MDGMGWDEQDNTDTAALWIKTLAVWKNIKGRDVGESACGLVQIQNGL